MYFSPFLIKGLPSNLHKDYSKSRLGSILTQFAKEVDETKHHLDLDEERERKRKKTLRRHTSMIEVGSGDRPKPVK